MTFNTRSIQHGVRSGNLGGKRESSTLLILELLDKIVTFSEQCAGSGGYQNNQTLNETNGSSQGQDVDDYDHHSAFSSSLL